MGQQILGVKLLETSTIPLFELGTRYVSPAGDTYQYMQADGAVTANLIYTIAAGYQIDVEISATAPADTKNGLAGCPQMAFADNAYGWVFIGPGNFTGKAAEDIDPTDILYGHATVGTLSDTASVVFMPGLTIQTAILSGATGTINAAHRMYAINPA